MTFSRIDSSIALTRSQSAAIAAIDPRLESFLAGYLVVDIVSEYEQRLEQMFVLRAKQLKDPPSTNFIAAMLSQRFRTPEVKKINDMLKKHDPAILKLFGDALAGTKWESAMNNLLIARHYYVHKSGSASSMTLRDIEQAYHDTVVLFDAIRDALGLTVAECAHLT